MPVIISNGNFIEDEFIANGGGFVELDQLSLATHEFEEKTTGIDVPSDTDPASLAGFINYVDAIRISFPHFHDGRGFSIARQLRQMGYKGLLRAHGHVLADQYPMAIRVGFDEIEISNQQAGRQPQSQWKEALLRTEDTYQERLMQPLKETA